MTAPRAALLLASLAALGPACEHNRTAELAQRGQLELACFENRTGSDTVRDREQEAGLARLLRQRAQVRAAFFAVSPEQLAALHGDQLALGSGRWLVAGSFELVSSPARGARFSFWLDPARRVDKGRPSLYWPRGSERPAGAAAAGLPGWLSWLARRQPASMPGQPPAPAPSEVEKAARLEALLARLAEEPCQLQLPGERCDQVQLIEGAQGVRALRVSIDHVVHYAPRPCVVEESLEVPLEGGGDLGARINRLTPRGPRPLRELKLVTPRY